MTESSAWPMEDIVRFPRLTPNFEFWAVLNCSLLFELIVVMNF